MKQHLHLCIILNIIINSCIEKYKIRNISLKITIHTFIIKYKNSFEKLNLL